MEDKVAMIVMSTLSDVQEMQRTLQSPSVQKDINNQLNWVKYLIQRFKGDLNQECTHPSRLWNEFAQTRFYQH